MSIDPDLIQKARDATPDINDEVARGISHQQMQDAEDFIDRIFYYASKDFPPGLTYEGCRRCTPEAEFKKATEGRDKRLVYELSRSDIYLMEYLFKFVDDDGVEHDIIRYMYLPFTDIGGLLHIRDVLMQIHPVLADPSYSRGDRLIFVNFTRIKLQFNRTDQFYLVDGEREIVNVAWCWVHNQVKRRNKNKSNSANIFYSTLANYIFAAYGFTQAVEEFAGAQVVVGRSDQITRENYPQSQWCICQPMGIKFKGQEPPDIRVAVPKEQYDSRVKGLLGGFFYIVTRRPHLVCAEDVDDTWMWKVILGEIINGPDQKHGVLVDEVNSHLTSIEGYMDQQVIGDLAYAGIHVDNIYELFMLIIDDLLASDINSTDSISSIYGKRLTTLRFVFFEITKQINTVMYTLRNAMKKRNHVGFNNINSAMNRSLQMRSIRKISNKQNHREVSPVACATDNMFFGLTSAMIPQDMASDQKSSKGKVNFNDKSKHLHVSLAEIGSFNNLPKSEPTGRSRINPFVVVGSDGSLLRREEFRDYLDKIQKRISR